MRCTTTLAATLAMVSLLGCKRSDERELAGADVEPDAAPAREDAETPAQPEAEPARPVDPSPGELVVLAKGARLYTAPRTDAPSYEAPASEASAVGPVLEVVGVEAKSDFLALRTLAPNQPSSCAGSFGIDDSYELEVFVRRSDLAPVLVEAVEAEFDDGAKLSFAPGVPVLAGTKPELSTLAVDQTRFELPIDTGAIGYWYRPGPASEAKGTVVFHSDELRYGGRELARVGEPYHRPGESVAAKPSEDGLLVTFAGPCGTFALFSPMPEIDKGDPNFDPDMVARQSGILGVMQQQGGHFLASPYGGALGGCRPDSWSIKAGTELTWESGGGPAGSARVEHTLADAALNEDKVCFASAGMRVCAAESDLVKTEGSGEDCEDIWGGLTGDEIGEAYGVGGLGLIGSGRGGGGEGNIGIGTSNGFGGRGAQVPKIRQAKATVSAGLSPDIVRRIVRAHIGEVRYCYGIGLQAEPTLAGRVELSFEINAQGKVSTAAVASAELQPANDSVPNCMVKKVKRWKFPKPEGGATVSVTSPFDLSAG